MHNETKIIATGSIPCIHLLLQLSSMRPVRRPLKTNTPKLRVWRRVLKHAGVLKLATEILDFTRQRAQNRTHRPITTHHSTTAFQSPRTTQPRRAFES